MDPSDRLPLGPGPITPRKSGGVGPVTQRIPTSVISTPERQEILRASEVAVRTWADFFAYESLAKRGVKFTDTDTDKLATQLAEFFAVHRKTQARFGGQVAFALLLVINIDDYMIKNNAYLSEPDGANLPEIPSMQQNRILYAKWREWYVTEVWERDADDLLPDDPEDDRTVTTLNEDVERQIFAKIQDEINKYLDKLMEFITKRIETMSFDDLATAMLRDPVLAPPSVYDMVDEIVDEAIRQGATTGPSRVPTGITPLFTPTGVPTAMRPRTITRTPYI